MTSDTPDKQDAAPASDLAEVIRREVGAVTIGRNEGERLRRCLTSLVDKVSKVVYVDSNSTDGSVEMARGLGVEVIELDLMTIPFTAPRARNEGFDLLLELCPDTKYVQFLDGDCSVVDGWLEKAYRKHDEEDNLAVVGGRRRELYPERSVYNQIADVEWDTPVGEATACHGDNMMRVEAFKEIGGYDPAVMTGEEAEMCFRLRAKGWRIFRLDAEMSRHDAAMTRLGQWWHRHRRTGFNYAELAYMHGRSPERLKVREVASVVLWALCVPLVILALAYPTAGLSLLLTHAYLVPMYRVYAWMKRRGYPRRIARPFAFFCVMSKFPQLLGVFSFIMRTLRGGKIVIIEYK